MYSLEFTALKAELKQLEKEVDLLRIIIILTIIALIISKVI